MEGTRTTWNATRKSKAAGGVMTSHKGMNEEATENIET